MKVGTSIFGFDPAIGCPFDDSEMKMVEEWRGFKIGMQVDFSPIHRQQLRGEIISIGENAKHFDGTPFVAFAIKASDGIHCQTHRGIFHVL